MDRDRFSDTIPNMNKPNLDVYYWLSTWTTDQPLINQWLPSNGKEKNHIDRLYDDNATKDVPSKYTDVFNKYLVCTNTIG